MELAVYSITNLNDGKVYVGSTLDKTARWFNHRSCLRRGVHENEYLQTAWDMDGEHSFAFTVLESPDSPDKLSERELWWFNEYDPFPPHGYNILRTSHDGTRGFKHSEETRRKWSETRKGKPMPPRSAEHCANISKAQTGRVGKTAGRKMPPKSEETRRKLSLSHMGQRCGMENNKAKLTDDGVRDIRARLAEGESGFSIAKSYGVNRQVIYRIRDRITWKHVE